MQRLGLGKSSGGSIAAGRNYNAQKGRLQERLRGVPTQCKDASGLAKQNSQLCQVREAGISSES